MIRTAIYARVSTEKQKKEGDSIAAQVSALRQYINERDDHINVGEYVDDGISGTKLDRDELQRLLNDVKAGKIDKIIFCKMDRWFRSIQHYVNTQELLDKYNVEWTAIWEPIYDSATPQGRLIINQMMSIAQFEAEHTGQRIRQVFSHKKSQGEVTNGKIPFGYTIKDKHLVPGSDAGNARKIFEYFAATGRMHDTCRYASTLGYSVDRRQMKLTLCNPRYIGQFSGNSNYCEPIIDPDLWKRVQAHIKAGSKCNTKRTYLFSGLIYCAECGLKFSTCRIGEASVYRCQGKYTRAIRSCINTRTIRETVLENYLLDNIVDMLAGGSALMETDRKEIEEDNTKQIAAIERKISRLKDLYINEEITLEEYKTDKAKYLEDLEQIKSRVPDPEPDHSQVIGLIGDDFTVRYATWAKQERKNFWRLIIDRITIDKDRKITVSFL